MPERPLGQLLTARKDACTTTAQLRGVTGVILVARPGRDRAQPVLAPCGVPDAHRGDLPEQLFGERVGNFAVHVQPRERRALLTAHAEARAQNAGRGTREVRARGDDAGILPAHLRDTRTRVSTRLELERDLPPDLVRAGEGHPGGPRVIDERGADLTTRAAQVIEDPGWEPCIAQAIGEQPS